MRDSDGVEIDTLRTTFCIYVVDWRMTWELALFFSALPSKLAVSSNRMTASAADHIGTNENDKM
jgi:hypothetical protein